MWRQKPQRPQPTYEDVRLVAEVLSRINPDLIERHFGLSADTAQQFMERLVAERRFGDLQCDGWHYPPIRKLRQRRTRRKPKVTTEFGIDEAIADQPESREDLTQRIDELEQDGYRLRATIKRLQGAGKTVIAQRDHWKSLALAAEEQMAMERDREASGQDRFDALRRIVVKELHPDACNGGQLEKLIRRNASRRSGRRSSGSWSAGSDPTRGKPASISHRSQPEIERRVQDHIADHTAKFRSNWSPCADHHMALNEFAFPILTVV